MEWEAQTKMYQWLTCTFENSCGCVALNMHGTRKMIEQID